MLKINFKLKFYFGLAVGVGALFLFLNSVQAAEIFFKLAPTEIHLGQLFELNVLVNTSNEDVNAFEGKIIFPDDLLTVKEIKDGDSLVNFWLDKPQVDLEDRIVFSGVTPGGYRDSQGWLFSVIFQPKNEGAGIITMEKARILLNDGRGTATSLTILPFEFKVWPATAEAPALAPTPEDQRPPEEFWPQVVRDPSIFNGHWFLIFATQDKGSGIDHYEVQEGNKSFVTVVSPYRLTKQKLDKEITVRVFDKSGNKRTVTLAASRPRKAYENYLTYAIIMIALGIISFVGREVWIKSKRSKRSSKK